MKLKLQRACFAVLVLFLIGFFALFFFARDVWPAGFETFGKNAFSGLSIIYLVLFLIITLWPGSPWKKG